MFGNRCQECGEVRWSIIVRATEKEAECPNCGARMLEERRHPGHRRARAGSERRNALPPRLTVS